MATTEALPVSKWRSPFEVILHRILADYRGEDEKVATGMETGMRKLFDRPYVDEFSEMVGVKELERCQQIIFFPQLSDMSHYTTIFNRSTPEETARKHKLLKFKVLSVMYSLHRKDGSLMDHFTLNGGLCALTSLLGEENNVIQSEAVELMMQLLDPLLKVQTASSKRQQLFHHEVFTCFCSGTFWLNCARILAEPAEVFPKSHENLLWLVSCAVGWLRPLEDASALPKVPPPGEVSEVKSALKAYLAGTMPKRPDLMQIATDLLADLQEGLHVRQPPLSEKDLRLARKAVEDNRDEEDAAHAWQSLKRLGNDGVAAGLLEPAEAAYCAALEAGGDYLPEKEASLIESNRALVLLRLKDYEKAADAAASALKLDGKNHKAAFRRAQALLGKPSMSLQDAQEALQAAQLAATEMSNDPKVGELVTKAQTKLEELRADATTQAESVTSPALGEMD
mmetsp:Transcript_7493/g.13453  ORF Transcript_7493/g.13453 Transcript_7493/m.13453 type:complete len:453 (+) Transcript_7493:74-1432(+)